MYCEKCMALFGTAICPICGGDTREPQPADLCYLTEKEVIWGGMLSDVLTQHEIPFLTKNMLGAGLATKLGSMLERVRFFVPYSRFEEAKALVEELFSATEE